ncbi:DUF6303 family protein [Streptomyces sp. NBC_01476]|uniref:DUF6303 family protein n=1 Tax=Streptomyces sp. NBC_01476 TaxID=2903881 RepID=UPI002E359034|nr:DUF6303 family protein [Streptomyces sp. NBC_01476]
MPVRLIHPLRAHMITSWDGTEWQVFVALPDESRWPHVPFPITAGVSSPAARNAALESLGYAPIADDHHTWEWMETTFEGDPDGTVSLIATTTVTPNTPDD